MLGSSVGRKRVPSQSTTGERVAANPFCEVMWGKEVKWVRCAFPLPVAEWVALLVPELRAGVQTLVPINYYQSSHIQYTFIPEVLNLITIVVGGQYIEWPNMQTCQYLNRSGIDLMNWIEVAKLPLVQILNYYWNSHQALAMNCWFRVWTNSR